MVSMPLDPTSSRPDPFGCGRILNGVILRLSMLGVARLWLAGALCLAPLAAQQRALDNGSEAWFDTIDARIFTESMPPRIDQPLGGLPSFTDLLPMAPQFSEERELVVELNFDQYNLEANPQRLVYWSPESLSLAADDHDGQALRIDSKTPDVAGVHRPLDPNRIAGRTVELSARIRIDQPYTVPDDAPSWAGPMVQVRWDRPHPDPAQRRIGEVAREWHSIFEGARSDGPDQFQPDGRFHTYRARFVAPDDLLGASLQVVNQRCIGTTLVDSVALVLIDTYEDRKLIASRRQGESNLLGPEYSFELGLGGAGVTGERRLTPFADGPVDRDFGEWRLDDQTAAEGKQSLKMYARPGSAAALELPWLALTAGQPYSLSLWMKADREPVKVAFGVADASWTVMGSPVEVGTGWKRYAATFTPGRTHAQAYWPWVTVEPSDSGCQVWVDGLQLEAGTGPSAYRTSARVEAAIEAGAQPGPGLRNVLSTSEPAKVVARLLQRGGQPRKVRVRAVLESHDGRLFQPLSNVPAEVELVPDTIAELPLLDQPLKRGLYRIWLVATDTATGAVTRAEQIMGVWDAPTTTWFGFHDGPGSEVRTPAVAEAARRVGASMLRTAGQPTADWRGHWTGEGTAEWSLFDRYLGEWSQQKIGLVHTLGPYLDAWPEWVIQEYGAQFRAPEKYPEAALLPPDMLWKAYLRDVIGRAAPTVDAYEVLTGADRLLSAAEYLPLAKQAREAVQALDPSAVLVGPSLTRAESARPGGFLDQLLAQADGPLFDVLSVRLYEAYPEELDIERDHLRELAGRHKLRLWDERIDYPETPLQTNRLNPRAGVDRRLMPFSPQPYDGAAFTARHALLWRAAGAELSFVSGSVAEVDYTHEPVGPLVEADGSPRSALAAMAVLASEIGPAKPLGEWRWDLSLDGPQADYDYRRPQGVRAVAFDKGDGTAVIAMWTFQRDATVNVEFAPAAKARILVTCGGEVQAPADGQLMLTHWPLYLTNVPLDAVAKLAELQIAGHKPQVVPAPGAVVVKPASGTLPRLQPRRDWVLAAR